LDLPVEERAFVAVARVGHLATVSEGGEPHVVPVCFALDGDVVYIALDEKPKRVVPQRLRRVRNIRASPRVMLLVDYYDEDWSKLGFVQLSGRAALLEGGREHENALALLRAKYEQYGGMELESRPLIRIALMASASWGRLDAEGP
jgi:PPOX class probable F420-dependent enzyme